MRSQTYCLLLLEPRDKRKVSQRNLYCLLEILVLKLSRDIKRAQYCQQHRESVNMNTFGQSEHDTRIWYHGTATSKACLQHFQVPPPFPPRGHLSGRFPRRYFSYLTPFFFLPFSPTAERGPGIVTSAGEIYRLLPAIKL